MPQRLPPVFRSGPLERRRGNALRSRCRQDCSPETTPSPLARRNGVHRYSARSQFKGPAPGEADKRRLCCGIAWRGWSLRSFRHMGYDQDISPKRLTAVYPSPKPWSSRGIVQCSRRRAITTALPVEAVVLHVCCEGRRLPTIKLSSSGSVKAALASISIDQAQPSIQREITRTHLV